MRFGANVQAVLDMRQRQTMMIKKNLNEFARLAVGMIVEWALEYIHHAKQLHIFSDSKPL